MVHMFFKLEYGLSVLIGEVIPEMKLQIHIKELLPQSNPFYNHLLLWKFFQLKKSWKGKDFKTFEKFSVCDLCRLSISKCTKNVSA